MPILLTKVVCHDSSPAQRVRQVSQPPILEAIAVSPPVVLRVLVLRATPVPGAVEEQVERLLRGGDDGSGTPGAAGPDEPELTNEDLFWDL